jgi:hypothetical protein
MAAWLALNLSVSGWTPLLALVVTMCRRTLNEALAHGAELGRLSLLLPLGLGLCLGTIEGARLTLATLAFLLVAGLIAYQTIPKEAEPDVKVPIIYVQLTQRGIAYEPLDNGIRSSADAARVQRIANTLDATKIEAVFRKWLRRLPHPFTAAHRAAGYRYQLSILQAEFALTQVLDRPRTGPRFFEESCARILTSAAPSDATDFRAPRLAQTPGAFRTRF